MLDATTLRELLSYDPETGQFTWRVRAPCRFTRAAQCRNWNGRYPGTVAGRVGARGYRAIAVLDKLYSAHRLAWLYVTGEWPADTIDHINGGRDDNRFANLRVVTNAENARHKGRRGFGSGGRLGVTRYPYHGRLRFVARIRVGGKLFHLGYFDTVEEATVAREAAERRFGFTVHEGSEPRGFEKGRNSSFSTTKSEKWEAK